MTLYDDLQLIRGKEYVVNEKISIRHPTLEEICSMGESKYYAMVHIFTATPADCMAQLDDMGIDYEDIDDFSLFMMLLKNVSVAESKILFGDLDFSQLKPMEYADTHELVLVDQERGIIVDKVIYEMISGYLRKMHGIKKNIQRAGNSFTKRFLIEEAKRKDKTPQKKSTLSLASLVLKLTNSHDFKYDIFNVWEIPFYVFMSSLQEVQKNVHYNHLMQGVYSGNIDRKKIPRTELSWFREE